MADIQTDLYLKRKVDSFLLEWKNKPYHKPLIVQGGKDSLVPVEVKANDGSTISLNHETRSFLYSYKS